MTYRLCSHDNGPRVLRGAWNGVRGKPPLEAMESYLLKVTDLCPRWLKEAEVDAPCEATISTEEELNKDLAWERDDAEEDERGAGIGLGVTVSTLAAGPG